MWFSEECRWKPKPRWGSVCLGDTVLSYGTCWKAKPRAAQYQRWHTAGSHPLTVALHKIQETPGEIHCLGISWKQLLDLRICSWFLFVWQGVVYVWRKGKSPGSLLFNGSNISGCKPFSLPFKLHFSEQQLLHSKKFRTGERLLCLRAFSCIKLLFFS